MTSGIRQKGVLKNATDYVFVTDVIDYSGVSLRPYYAGSSAAPVEQEPHFRLQKGAHLTRALFAAVVAWTIDVYRVYATGVRPL